MGSFRVLKSARLRVPRFPLGHSVAPILTIFVGLHALCALRVSGVEKERAHCYVEMGRNFSLSVGFIEATGCDGSLVRESMMAGEAGW